jgi:hypothetical protein
MAAGCVRRTIFLLSRRPTFSPTKTRHIIDASLFVAPHQRNEDEKRAIKKGRIPQDWKDKPAKLRPKDRDASRTQVHQS